MALVNDLKRVLLAEFPGAEVHLKRLKPGNSIGGSLIWEGFDSQPQIDRQVKLREVIETALPSGTRAHLSLIMTLTPDEEAVLSVQ